MNIDAPYELATCSTCNQKENMCKCKQKNLVYPKCRTCKNGDQGHCNHRSSKKHKEICQACEPMAKAKAENEIQKLESMENNKKIIWNTCKSCMGVDNPEYIDACVNISCKTLADRTIADRRIVEQKKCVNQLKSILDW
jgi:hypothetical protein